MSKLRLYQYAAGALLVINITMIGLFFWTMPPRMHPPGPHPQTAFQHLNLDASQHSAFMALAEQHIQLMKTLDEQQQALLKTYFQQLIDQENSTPDEQLMRQIQALHGEKVERTYQHLADVKALLRPEQQEKFKEFYNQIISQLAPKEKNSPPPPKDF